MGSRRPLLAVIAIVLGTLGSSVLVGAPASADPLRCDAWPGRGDFEANPRYEGSGAVDSSIEFELQGRECTVGPASRFWDYRVAVRNQLANGKRDIVVAFKSTPISSCGSTPNKTFGTWHPVIPAGQTYYSPAYAAGPAASLGWLRAEVKVYYGRSVTSFGSFCLHDAS